MISFIAIPNGRIMNNCPIIFIKESATSVITISFRFIKVLKKTDFNMKKVVSEYKILDMIKNKIIKYLLPGLISDIAIFLESSAFNFFEYIRLKELVII